MMDKEIWQEPDCLLCMQSGEAGRPVPIDRIYAKLGEYEDRGDREGAERHLCYWLQEAEQTGDERGQLTLNNELMGHYRMRGNGEKARFHARRAAQLVEKLGVEETVTAGTTWVNAGTVAEAFGERAEALRWFEKARGNYEKNLPETDPRLGGLYNNMALALVGLERYDEAEALFSAALKVMRRQPHGELEQAITWLNLADAKAAKLGPEEAEASVEACLEKASELLDTPGLTRNGYYAFVCEKCAPVFGHYGYFLKETELNGRADAIRKEKNAKPEG